MLQQDGLGEPDEFEHSLAQVLHYLARRLLTLGQELHGYLVGERNPEAGVLLTALDPPGKIRRLAHRVREFLDTRLLAGWIVG